MRIFNVVSIKKHNDDIITAAAIVAPRTFDYANDLVTTFVHKEVVVTVVVTFMHSPFTSVSKHLCDMCCCLCNLIVRGPRSLIVESKNDFDSTRQNIVQLRNSDAPGLRASSQPCTRNPKAQTRSSGLAALRVLGGRSLLLSRHTLQFSDVG